MSGSTNIILALFLFAVLTGSALAAFFLIVSFFKMRSRNRQAGIADFPLGKTIPAHIFLEGFQDTRLPEKMRLPALSVSKAASGRLRDRYEIHNILGGPGKSGMGVVLVAYDLTEQRVVALKTFQEDVASSSRTKAVFRQEAVAWIRLGKHPAIVQALRVENIEDRLYIVMEYIAPDKNGHNTLTHYLSGRPLLLELVCNWAVEICEGMMYALKNKILCHRDLKPDNIMITADQRAKITDFGLAKIFIGSDGPVGDGAAGSGMSGSRQYSATLHGEGCGSPPWMPPEQFYNARQSNVRNDVYSFGVMLFQMASGGYLPFAGKTYDDYYHQHETGSVPELESPFFPVILRCMEKNPAKRYGSFKAIRRELLRIAGKAGVPLRGGWFKWRKADAAEFFNWGESLQLLRRPGEAISYYDRALSQNPYNAIIWNSKGRCLGDLQRDREALSCFEWAIRINNQYADAWFNLAVAGESNRSVSLAVDAYRNYLRLDQESRDDAAFKRFAEERIKTLTEW